MIAVPIAATRRAYEPATRDELARLSYVVVDVETTGTQAWGGDRITEIAAIVVRDGVVAERFETLVNPERPIPPLITSLTHITWEMVKDAPRFRRHLRRRAPRAARDTCSSRTTRHSTGASCAPRCSARRGRRSPVAGCARCGSRGACSRSCAAAVSTRVAHHYGVEIHARHRAAGDAVATAHVLLRLLTRRASASAAAGTISSASSRRASGARPRRGGRARCRAPCDEDAHGVSAPQPLVASPARSARGRCTPSRPAARSSMAARCSAWCRSRSGSAASRPTSATGSRSACAACSSSTTSASCSSTPGAGNKENAKFHDIYGIENAGDGGAHGARGRARAARAHAGGHRARDQYAPALRSRGRQHVSRRRGGEVRPDLSERALRGAARGVRLRDAHERAHRGELLPAQLRAGARKRGCFDFVEGEQEIVAGHPRDPDARARAGHQGILLESTAENRRSISADLVPTAAHLPLPWIMGYDVEPLVTLETKRRILKRARRRGVAGDLRARRDARLGAGRQRREVVRSGAVSRGWVPAHHGVMCECGAHLDLGVPAAKLRYNNKVERVIRSHPPALALDARCAAGVPVFDWRPPRGRSSRVADSGVVSAFFFVLVGGFAHSG